VWQKLAGEPTSETPSLARKVLDMLGDSQGTMRKVRGAPAALAHQTEL
jgi:hypothetical protein